MARGGGGGSGSGSGSGGGTGRGSSSGRGKWKKLWDTIAKPFSCFSVTPTVEATPPVDISPLPPPEPAQDNPMPDISETEKGDPSSAAPETAQGEQSLALVPEPTSETAQGDQSLAVVPASTSARETAQGDRTQALVPTTVQGNQSLLLVPTWESGEHRRSESESSDRARECNVCLEEMKTGDPETGDVLYTGACGHVFHFMCVVRLVNSQHDCPICRKKWKIIPAVPPKERKEIVVQALQERMGSSIPRARAIMIRSPSTTGAGLLALPEALNDDEFVGREITITEIPENVDSSRMVRINTHTQMSTVPSSSAVKTFTVLVHLKAPSLVKDQIISRAPVDLVAVLDISGSMVGTKIALLKEAMRFVIGNLEQNDRLSVVSFASEAQRLFPLRRMTDNGRRQALQAVGALEAIGGTNIVEGLRIGARVMEDRYVSNRVAYILLLSDGRDTNTLNYSGFGQNLEQPNYKELLPTSIGMEENSGPKISVHTFGFGADHDALALHTISDVSGGTFSFIENEEVIQAAFAQCIGGLLSVVATNLFVRLECVDQGVHLGSLETGKYPNHIFSNQRAGAITVGEMYADEERDFLVSIDVPSETSGNETNLLKVGCVYHDPLANTQRIVEAVGVRIESVDAARQEEISIEVDRQQNRIRAAEAMAEAQTAAEDRDLEGAASILEKARKALSETVSFRSQDQLCISLVAELKKVQERMLNRPMYEKSGRALILSGLSSHSWQRATARGDLIGGSMGRFWTYQTPSMSHLVRHSQASNSSP